MGGDSELEDVDDDNRSFPLNEKGVGTSEVVVEVVGGSDGVVVDLVELVDGVIVLGGEGNRL